MVDCHPRVNLFSEQIDESCRHLISPADAWGNMVLPLRLDDAGALLCATTPHTIDQASKLLKRKLGIPFHFVMADAHQLEQHIAEVYEFEGVELGD